MCVCFLLYCRPRRRQPAWRGVRQRPAAARHRPAADRRAGAQRRQAVRHLQAAQGQPRMRLEDPLEVSQLCSHESSASLSPHQFSPRCFMHDKLPEGGEERGGKRERGGVFLPPLCTHAEHMNIAADSLDVTLTDLGTEYNAFIRRTPPRLLP